MITKKRSIRYYIISALIFTIIFVIAAHFATCTPENMRYLDYGIKIFNNSGQELVKLPYEASEMAWSPDGTKLAFCTISDDNQITDIMLVNSDGSGLVNITNCEKGKHCSGLNWSSDSNRILYSIAQTSVTHISLNTSETTTVSNIYLMNSNGSNSIKLAAGSEPEWSPDNSKILFSSKDGIYAMNTDGSNQTRLAAGYAAKWFPDGNQILFQQRVSNGSNFIYLIRPDGTSQTKLATGFEPRWSSDASQLTYTNGNNDFDDNQYFIINRDGSNNYQLKYKDRSISPYWSPDSKKIAFFNELRDYSVAREPFKADSSLHIMDTGGSNVVTLATFIDVTLREVSLSWSANGTQVLFSYYGYYYSSLQSSPVSGLYLMNSDGSNIILLSKYSNDNYEYNYNKDNMVWSPDGSKIATITLKVPVY